MTTGFPSPHRILDIGCGYRASKVLLSAIELDVFTILAEQPLDAAALTQRTGLHKRGATDFFDALVALGMLTRGEDGLYSDAYETGFYLDRRKPTYIGSMFEQYSAAEYGLWNSLTRALQTGMPQTGIAAAQHFASLYAESTKFRRFVQSMTAGSLLAAKAVATQFPWQHYQTFADVGTAEGCLPVEVTRAHPHMRGCGFDLPELQDMFEAYVRKHGVADRVEFCSGDFFTMPLPRADVIMLGRILHNWDLETKHMLLRKAYDALPRGGALIVHETLIADDRRSNPAGMLASLNMLLWTMGGFDFSGADCARWMKDAGFRDIQIEALAAEQSMIIGKKL
jgi:precorrin-6B methylase 2